MKHTLLATAVMLAAAAATAQSPADNVKFTKSASPVTSSTSTGNPQYQFYHAQFTGAAWGDVNNDGYPDLFYSDRNSHINNSTLQVNLYYNNGNGTFRRGGKGVLKGTAFSSPVWIDFDNDGRIDLLVAGLDNYGYRWRDADTDLSLIGAHLYRNFSTGSTGAVTFQEVSGHGLRPLYNGNTGGKSHSWISVGDYDNDGYPDIVMQGFDEAARYDSDEPMEAKRAVYLYHNNGDGTFELVANPLDGTSPFHGLTDGSVVLEDIDGDGLLDLFTTGYGSTRTSEIYIYWNNGDGTFTEHADHFYPVTNGTSTVADLDGDGLADLIFAGHYLNNGGKNFYICKNMGDRKFEMLSREQFEGCDGTQIAVGDVNNDGLADILVGGHFSNHEHTTLIYVNKGNFEFDSYGAHYDDAFGKKGHFSRITHGTHHLVDVNRDGNLDAWFSGWCNGDCGNGCSTELWLNAGADKGQQANTPPAAPDGLNAVTDTDAGTVTFSWNAPADDTTPAAALRYNLYLRDTATGKIMSTLPADIATGYIRVAATNGALRRCEHTMAIPSDGSYQWGVQAIDAANQGGEFASSAIEIAGVGTIVTDDAAVTVEGGEGRIHITAPDGATAKVHTASGIMTANVTVDFMTATVEASAGVYIVTVNTAGNKSAHKVIVR